MAKCPPGKIINPKTGRCVLRSGKIGQQILQDRKKKTASKKTTTGKASSSKYSVKTHVFNEKTGRWVKRDGKIGRQILGKENVSRKAAAKTPSKTPRKSVLSKRAAKSEPPKRSKKALKKPSKSATIKSPVQLRSKYLNCLLDVASKQSPACLRAVARGGVKGGEIVAGKKCSNPYAICTKTTGRTGRISSVGYYDWDSLPDNKLKTYAYLKSPKIKIPRPYNKPEMIANIRAYEKKAM